MFNDEFKSRYTSIPFATFERNHIGSETDIHTLSHNHKEVELLAVLDGKARFFIDSEIIDASKGDLIIVSPYSVHHTTLFSDKNFRHICVCFSMELVNDIELADSVVNGNAVLPCVIKNGSLASDVLQSYITDSYNASLNKKDGWELKVKGCLMLFFGTLKENGYIKMTTDAKRTNEVFRKIMKYIDEHYAEDVTSTDIAENLYISTSHFCRIFKQNFGHCFQKFLCMYRIEKSKAMLKNESLSISEISVKTGFKSFSYFSKMFKEYTSYTPSEYRQFNKAFQE